MFHTADQSLLLLGLVFEACGPRRVRCKKLVLCNVKVILLDLFTSWNVLFWVLYEESTDQIISKLIKWGKNKVSIRWVSVCRWIKSGIKCTPGNAHGLWCPENKMQSEEIIVYRKWRRWDVFVYSLVIRLRCIIKRLRNLEFLYQEARRLLKY